MRRLLRNLMHIPRIGAVLDENERLASGLQRIAHDAPFLKPALPSEPILEARLQAEWEAADLARGFLGSRFPPGERL